MKLRYTLRGAAELSEVLAYIETQSPQGARRVQTRIQIIIDLLLRHPHAGQLTSKGRLRRITASPYPYLIFYRAARGRDRDSWSTPWRPPSVVHAGVT